MELKTTVEDREKFKLVCTVIDGPESFIPSICSDIDTLESRCAKLEAALGVANNFLDDIKRQNDDGGISIGWLMYKSSEAESDILTRIKEITGETAKGDGG